MNLCFISDPAMIIIILLSVNSNPYLRCIDVELVSKLCHTHGVLACIDETFATPVTQLALTLDADLVLSSATKIPRGSQ
jgi:cystathionine gamma-synthase